MFKFTVCTILAWLVVCPIDPKVWCPLASFRPTTEIQSQVKSIGDGWKVHRLEEGDSYLNLDYYSLQIAKLPTVEGKQLTKLQAFDKFKAHLVDTNRSSASRVEFTFVNKNSKIDTTGSLLRLRFKAFSLANCQNLAYCGDIDWLKDNKYCEAMDKKIAPLLSKPSIDDAIIVVSQSTPKEIRVSTVQGGKAVLAGLSYENTGAHPVAGNRAFGYSDASNGGMIIYTIGADRLNGLELTPKDRLAKFGYCAAEIFWREFLNEYKTWVNANGGKANFGTCERKTLDWNESVKQKIWDPSGQKSPEWEN